MNTRRLSINGERSVTLNTQNNTITVSSEVILTVLTISAYKATIVHVVLAVWNGAMIVSTKTTLSWHRFALVDRHRCILQ